jgi:hypothetical protein
MMTKKAVYGKRGPAIVRPLRRGKVVTSDKLLVSLSNLDAPTVAVRAPGS